MRKHGAKQRDEAAIDMTPMLDIVFIMLIFFIVTASFLKESGIEVNRPDGSSANPQEKANIMIAVTADNEIWMEKRRIDVRAVRANVERLKAENPEGTIVIQADEQSSTGLVSEIMDSLNAGGYTDHVLSLEGN
jgi:biopolymer transport protein ExbD